MGPVNVLQVTYTMDRGGAETLIMNVLRSMDRNKVHFDFLENTVAGEDGVYDDEIRSYGCGVYKLPSFVKHPVLYTQNCKRFFAEHPDYDVVHGHFLQSAAPVYFAYAKRHEMYTIAHSHNTSDGSFAKDRILSTLRAPLRHMADYKLACSRAAGVYMFGKGVVNSPTFEVVNNGFDLSRFRESRARHDAAQRRLGFSGRYVVGHVGRFSDQKNHAFLVKVFAELLRIVPEAHLLLVGSGPLENEIRNQVKNIGITSHVSFAGGASDICSFYDAMDVFLFPSKYEGLGNVLIEAQASGLPIIMSSGSLIKGANDICSENLTVLQLDSPISRWVDACKEARSPLPQEECIGRIKAQGFDIRDVTEQLTHIYQYGAQSRR